MNASHRKRYCCHFFSVLKFILLWFFSAPESVGSLRCFPFPHLSLILKLQHAGRIKRESLVPLMPVAFSSCMGLRNGESIISVKLIFHKGLCSMTTDIIIVVLLYLFRKYANKTVLFIFSCMETICKMGNKLLQ